MLDCLMSASLLDNGFSLLGLRPPLLGNHEDCLGLCPAPSGPHTMPSFAPRTHMLHSGEMEGTKVPLGAGLQMCRGWRVRQAWSLGAVWVEG